MYNALASITICMCVGLVCVEGGGYGVCVWRVVGMVCVCVEGGGYGVCVWWVGG